MTTLLQVFTAQSKNGHVKPHQVTKHTHAPCFQLNMLHVIQARCRDASIEFGCFATVVEGALAHAKFLGKAGAAEEADAVEHLSNRRAASMSMAETEATATMPQPQKV